MNNPPSYARFLLTICIITFACYVASHMRMPVVPLYARHLGIPTSQIGWINSTFFLMAGLLSLPLGMISDRIGRKFLVATGLILLAVSSFLLCLGQTILEFVGIYALFGIGMAAFGPPMMTMVADHSPPSHLGRSYGWYTTSVFCGMSLGPAIGGYMAKWKGFCPVFILSGTMCFIIFGATLAFFSVAKKQNPSDKPHISKSSSLMRLFGNHPLLGCWATALGGCFGLGMFLTYLPLHIQNQGLDVRQIGLIFSIQGLFNGLSRIPFGHLSDKIRDRRHLVKIGLVGFAVSMAGYGYSQSFVEFILFSVTFGVSMGLAFTSVGALLAESVEPEFRGLAMGGYNTCIYLGMMVSSGTMGMVIQMIGFQSAFYATAGMNLLLIGVFVALMRGFVPRT